MLTAWAVARWKGRNAPATLDTAPGKLNDAILALLGFGMVLLGIVGDLFESRLKREAHVKDSGSLIPGHGGVLDRIDALLFVTPLFVMAAGVAR